MIAGLICSIVDAFPRNIQKISSQVTFKADTAKVYRARIDTSAELVMLINYTTTFNLDTWTRPRIGNVDILIEREEEANLLSAELSNPLNVLIDDVDSVIKSSSKTSNDTAFLDGYQSYEDIQIWMMTMSTSYPEICELFSIGTTWEGREIQGLRIRSGNGKPIILHGAMHGREWITTSTVLLFAEELLTRYSDPRIKHLVETFEWSLIPVLNVDGYAYTRDRNRLWRKNRQPTSVPYCAGIDIERNWGFKWGLASADPCSETYQGTEPFTSLEAKAISDYIIEKDPVAYFDLHAYGQLFMYPFSYACIPARDEEDLLEAAMGATQAILHTHGAKYSVGSICDLLFENSGESIDWTYAERGVKYSYTIELRDTGMYGFLLPERFIRPTAEEISSAVLYIAEFIDKKTK